MFHKDELLIKPKQFLNIARQCASLGIVFALLSFNIAHAGILVTASNGISLTGSDGVQYVGVSGFRLPGADSYLGYTTNGISLTGADGISLTGADGAISLTGADGATYTGSNGISLTGADGISLTGADGISLTGADGAISLTGADGSTIRANSLKIISPTGISLTGADGVSLIGIDGVSITGTNISLTGADGISLTGADGISLTGADGIIGTAADGTPFSVPRINAAISLTGADGISITAANGISLTGADGISLTGADGENGAIEFSGLQSVDPELAAKLSSMTDDSGINASIIFHQYPNETDFNNLRQAGILGGTKFKKLPVVMVTAARSQLIAVSHLANVSSIYGVRTLNLNSDPYYANTQISRLAADRDLQNANQGVAVTGRGVTVAVLDTGVNSLHGDLSNRVINNVKLADLQSVPGGFNFPIPTENVPNTDFAAGHGTFVAGIIGGSGAASGGKYGGVAPGAKILGLSAGDLNLTHVLSGFDYLLDKGANYNVRVVNCSFSSDTVFDNNDPVNIATKMLTERGVNVVFSAGNTGPGNASLNPYAAAPWVVSVGAIDQTGNLASFSSRGIFGSRQFTPSLAAPGVSVVSLRSLPTQTGILGVAGADPTRLTPAELPYYTTASGTSFSAPQVAGAIALMLEANPNLQPAEVKDILQRTATALPPYFKHEVGGGMLNTYAAVLESAFSARRMGIWRANLDLGQINFITEAPAFFSGTAYPGASTVRNGNFAADAVQTSVYLAWGDIFSPNDLALFVKDANGNVKGESNYLNLYGLGGHRERITFNTAPLSDWRISVNHTGGVGTAQTFAGAVVTTRVEYENLNDLSALPVETQNAVKESLRSFQVLPEGRRFRPNDPVLRSELAASLVRGGRIPQYLAANPLFTDVRDLSARGIVESVQRSPKGILFYDSPINGAFRPFQPVSRLIAAVALVRAAGFQNLAEQPINSAVPTADAAAIPAAYRGYVTVALQKHLLNKNGANFSPGNSLNRTELALAMNALNKCFMP